MEFTVELKRYIDHVEGGIELRLPAAQTPPERLHAAMRYSLQAGGKRLRPVLVLAAAEMLGGQLEHALPAAIAVECVHTYSLIHDDLPCMDNDDLRRGRPTAHKAFDEATALLAGDALLTHAFILLAETYAPDPILAHALVRELANAAGSGRLIGGQMEDLLAEKRGTTTAEALEFIHRNKTAAMIEASLAMGGLTAGASSEVLAKLRRAGAHLGLAFQIVDDLLDVTADTATLGKTAGKDAKAGKATYVSLHGLKASRQLAAEHSTKAREIFSALRPTSPFLPALVDWMATRGR